jgi:hypothetical protein
VLAVLLPLLGIGRRLGYTSLLQLAVASQLACYALRVCYAGPLAAGGGGAAAAGGGGASGYLLLPAAYFSVG